MALPVKFEDIMRELFSPKERADIRRAANTFATRHALVSVVARSKPNKNAAWVDTKGHPERREDYSAMRDPKAAAHEERD